MKNNYAKWILITCLVSLIIPGITAGINYFMDPLWCFSLSHKYNQKQDDFNERQQKTNYITFHDFDYQGIIIGTSTSTTLRQDAFEGTRVYNYAINGLHLEEYRPYLHYAEKRNGSDFEYIFLGLDFMYSARLPRPSMDPEKIFAETNNPFYRIKTLVSIDTIKLSRRNFMNYLYGRRIHYDRNNIKYTAVLSREFQDANMKIILAHFEKSDAAYSFNNYTYSDGYIQKLKELRDGSPKSKIVPFTTPVVVELLASLVKNGLLDDYLRWVREIVEVYGVCYHFMYPNSVTEDFRTHFNDPNHYYPFVSRMMVDFMFNGKPAARGDFGMRIDRNNLNESLAHLERLMKRAARAR